MLKNEHRAAPWMGINEVSVTRLAAEPQFSRKNLIQHVWGLALQVGGMAEGLRPKIMLVAFWKIKAEWILMVRSLYTVVFILLSTTAFWWWLPTPLCLIPWPFERSLFKKSLEVYMPLSVQYCLIGAPVSAASWSNWSLAWAVSVPVIPSWWMTVTLPLALPYNKVLTRYFWVYREWPWAVKWLPLRRSWYWSENIRSPDSSWLTLMDTPLWLSLGDFPLEVRYCLSSWKAAQGGGFTVVDLNLILRLPIILVRPSHWQC